MKHFLKHIADYLLEGHSREFQQMTLVFPNRRADLWFHKHLADTSEKTIWSPRTFTITDFLEELTGRQVSDPVPLVLELYRIFREIPGRQEEPPDHFYPWGEMLLNDFDDVDKYLVNSGDLFRNLKSLKEISFDYLRPEELELIRRFWDHFPAESDSAEAHAFTSLWDHLARIYEDFRKKLFEKGLAYEGMIYREAAERARQGNLLDHWEGMVCFVGFYALTPAEEAVFEAFREQNRGLFFWDYDLAYLDNPELKSHGSRDPGAYIRKYRKRFPPPEDFEDEVLFDNLKKAEKHLQVYAVPQRTAQTAVMHEQLDNWHKDPGFTPENTAIVLGDEQLLIPVIHALPEQIDAVNITMGFPLRETPLFGLFRMVMELNIHAMREKTGPVRFHTSRILEILHHPLITPVVETAWHAWEQKMRSENRFWCSVAEMPDPGILEPLFAAGSDTRTFSLRLNEMLYHLVFNKAERKGSETNLDLEALYRIQLLVNRLNDTLSDYHDFWPADQTRENLLFYLRLLIRIAGTVKIPFSGEPLIGVQVMGVLETRLLDFDRVILLSFNENTLPAGVTAVNSFIPFNLRKGFGMPTFDHRDNVYNYYFLRLIQRAKEVTLIYHSGTEGGQTGEPSRFIPQLEYLLGLSPEKKHLALTPSVEKTSAITIPRNGEIQAQIIKLLQEGISPSALNTWLNCSLKFYFRYIAGIREADEIIDEVDQAAMGQLFHRTMEEVYKPWLGRMLETGDIEKLIRDRVYLKSCIEQAAGNIPSLNAGNSGSGGGYREILKTATLDFVILVLRHDQKRAPYTVLNLEQSFSRMLQHDTVPVQIRGFLDRMDQSAGAYTIIDYKTGHPPNNMSIDLAGLFDPRNKNRKGEAFQILLYSWIIRGLKNIPVVPMLYFIRKMNDPQVDMRLKQGKVVLEDFSAIEPEFEELLHQLIDNMMNEQVPFQPTEFEERCRYCPYIEICRDREPVL